MQTAILKDRTGRVFGVCKRVACAIAVGVLLLGGCESQSEATQLAKARSAVQKEDLATAIVVLKRTLQDNPTSSEARYLLGEALLKTGDAPAAVVELEKARSAGFDPALTLPMLGRALLATAQPRKLIDDLGEVTIADNAALADLRATVAAAYGALGEHGRSEATAHLALSLDPKNTAARLLIARVAGGRGEFDAALQLVAEVLSDRPRLREAWQLKGELLWAGKRDDSAGLAAFRETLLIDPGYVPAHTAVLSILAERRDMDAYRAQFRQLQKAVPRHPETQLVQARLAMMDGDVETARTLAQNLLKIMPDSPVALEFAGSVQAQLGALLVAESHLARAVQLAPATPSPRRLLAQIHIRAGQPSRALSVLLPLLQMSPPDGQALAIAGEAHLASGNAGVAEEFFVRAAAASPDDERVKAAVALSQVRAGRTEEGLTRLWTLSESTADTHADMVLVSALMSRADWPNALRAIDGLVKKAPQNALPHRLRATVLTEQNQLTAARQSLEQALAIDGAYFPAVSDLSLLDVREGRPDAALSRLQLFLNANPRSDLAMTSIADLKRRTGAPPDQVLRLLQEAILIAPRSVAPRLLAIDHHLALGEVPAARTFAQAAIAELPEDMLLQDAMGRVHLAAGDTEQAITTFNGIAAAHPTIAQPLLRLSEAHSRVRNYRAAQQALQRALDISPRLLDAQRGLAQLAMLQGRPDDALKLAQQVQNQRPEQSIGFLMEGEIHAAKRRWQAAITAMRTALERERISGVATRVHTVFLDAGRTADAKEFAEDWMREHPNDATVLNHLGSAAMAGRDWPGAEARFRAVLALRPSDAAALNNVAWLMLLQGKSGALPYAEQANKIMPDNPGVMDTLSMALLAEGQAARALEMQRAAVARAPNSPGLELNLARILLETGNRADARSILTRLSGLGDRFDRQEEVALLLARAR